MFYSKISKKAFSEFLSYLCSELFEKYNSTYHFSPILIHIFVNNSSILNYFQQKYIVLNNSTDSMETLASIKCLQLFNTCKETPMSMLLSVFSIVSILILFQGHKKIIEKLRLR